MPDIQVAYHLCFWCGTSAPSTWDHIISKPLARQRGIRGRGQWVVRACFQCNQERSKISCAYAELHRCAASLSRTRQMKQLRGDLQPMLAKWWQLISAKINDDILLGHCQHELRALLTS